MSDLKRNVATILHCALVIAGLVTLSLMVFHPKLQRSGIVEVAFDRLLFRRRFGDNIPRPDKIATKVAGSAAAAASHVKTAAPDAVSSAIAAGESLVADLAPTGFSVGTRLGCLDIGKQAKCLPFDAMLSLLVINIFILSTSLVAIGLPRMPRLPTLTRPVLSAASLLFSSLLAATTLTIIGLARRIEDIGANIKLGLAFTGSMLVWGFMLVHAARLVTLWRDEQSSAASW